MSRKKPGRSIGSTPGTAARLFRFIDIASFTEDWAELRFGDDELRALEDAIARNPERAPVVPGGGGVRKLRRADPSSQSGKRGGYRVRYAFFLAFGVVLLIAAWPKSEREDLERSDYDAIAKLITRIQKLWRQGTIS